MQSPTFSNYCRIVFAPFFKWWWAAITGVASILSYLALPESGLNVSKIGVAFGILGVMFLLFLVLSVVWQGWLLFADRFAELRVGAINKCEDFGGHYVVILIGPRLAPGSVVELHRFVDGIEVPVALVEVLHTNSAGELQAKPLWFAQGHLNDFIERKYEPAELRVRLVVSRPVIVKYLDPLRAEPTE